MPIRAGPTLGCRRGGRAWPGTGAGGSAAGPRWHGAPYPGTSEGLGRPEETRQLAHQVWSGDDSPFEGGHYRLGRPLNSPAALSKPHPPILIGGGGEKKTLRMVAQYADACNIFDMGPDGVKAKYDVIRGHCETVGRDYADIEKTVLSRVNLAQESVEQVVERVGQLGASGTEHESGREGWREGGWTRGGGRRRRVV